MAKTTKTKRNGLAKSAGRALAGSKAATERKQPRRHDSPATRTLSKSAAKKKRPEIDRASTPTVTLLIKRRARTDKVEAGPWAITSLPQASTAHAAPAAPTDSIPRNASSKAASRTTRVDRRPQAGNLIDAPFSPSETPAHSTPRPHTKLAIGIGMLQRDEGATLDALVARTGWLPHTTRAMLTGLRKKGFGLARTRGEDQVTRYRIAAMPTGSESPNNVRSEAAGANSATGAVPAGSSVKAARARA